MLAAPARTGELTVALVSEVFWEPDGLGRLAERLDQCVQRGADLAVLPELALNPWRPATKDAVDDDAEPMDGPRASAQAEAARGGGDRPGGRDHPPRPRDGRRTSRALVFDRSGALVATYEKLHLPEEPGFWETSHYEPGTEAPQRIDAFGLPDRRPALQRHEPAGGLAPARRAGRAGDPDPACHRGADLPALEVRLPRQRADQLQLRPLRQPAGPGGRGAHRRARRSRSIPTAPSWSRRPTGSRS